MQVLVDDVVFYSCVYDVHFCRQRISSQLIGLLLATRGRTVISAVRAAGARGGLLLVELQGAEWLCTSDAPAGLQLRLVPPPKGRNAASFPMWSALSALAGYSVVLYRRGEYSQHACARPMSGTGLHWPY